MMFGYLRYDLPNLFVKDVVLYRALYCGLCKGIGEACGQRARMGLTYDMTFFSAFLHNATGTDIRVVPQNCFEHAVRKRPIAATDDLTRELGALNTVLLYYKLADDVADGEGGKARRRWFGRGFRRAKKAYPALVALVETFLGAQAAAEKGRTPSPDEAAEPTAALMRELSDHFLGEHASEHTRGLFYALGKWVYLIDALDDYEKDAKKGNYNPFVLMGEGAPRAEFAAREDVRFLFDTLFYSMREHLAGIPFYFNRDLTDNVILRGIPLETRRVLNGEKRAKRKKPEIQGVVL